MGLAPESVSVKRSSFIKGWWLNCRLAASLATPWHPSFHPHPFASLSHPHPLVSAPRSRSNRLPEQETFARGCSLGEPGSIQLVCAPNWTAETALINCPSPLVAPTGSPLSLSPFRPGLIVEHVVNAILSALSPRTEEVLWFLMSFKRFVSLDAFFSAII